MSTFTERALRLREQGYKIIPIPRGQKRPVEEGWETFDPSPQQIKRWGESRYKNGNIGILAEHTPAVDLDIYEADLAEELQDWIIRQFGDTCVRVGRAPKSLLVFRADKPFRKMQCVYSDGARDHGVEVLGHGQQFVAYGTHPDTGKDYVWTSLDEPLDCPADSLPTLSPEDADVILDKFEALAQERGWTRKRRSGAREISDEDAFERYKPICAVTLERVEETLDLLANDDADYDTYLDIGMALHHQFRGGDDGLKLWHDWASKSSKYIAEDLNRRWSSFGHGPDTVTFATMLYRAKEVKADEEERVFQRAIQRIDNCPDTKILYGDAMKSVGAAITTELQFDIACKRIQDRVRDLTETKPRLEVIRKMLTAARPKSHMAVRDMPKWCEGWCFVGKNNNFYNTDTGEVYTKPAFDTWYGPELVTDEMRSAGESTGGRASDVAVNLFRIPRVYDAVYLPGEGQFFSLNGMSCVNTFVERSTPPSKQPSTGDDYAAIALIEKHFENLFPDPREREIILDFLAYNVQFPAEKITWGVVVQGVDGAGKTFMADLMAAVIGGANVRSVLASSLKEQFTGWAEGKKMVFFEEIRVAERDTKFEIIEKLKPYVTNRDVPVRRMQRDAYNIPNVTNYVFFTNYLDALPLSVSDRRYFVVRTSFQTVSHIRSFLEKHPDYFDDLYNALSFNPEALRHYFLTRRIADSFKAKGHAPDTDAKAEMREAASTGEDAGDEIEFLLNQGDPEISDVLLNSTKLRETSTLGSIGPRAYGAMLAKAGFALIGNFRVDGVTKANYYTRHSERFVGESWQKLAAIRAILDPPLDDGF